MEMTAAIEGLRVLRRPCQVRALTDSEYLLRGMTQFLERWQSNGWRSASGNGTANQDLWAELAELASYHRTGHGSMSAAIPDIVTRNAAIGWRHRRRGK
jgi:ribonuclease HI